MYFAMLLVYKAIRSTIATTLFQC